MASLAVSTSTRDILLQEEFLAIESIFFDRCKSFQKDRRVQIELELCSTDARLVVEYALPQNYPDSPCVMRVVVSEKIPKEIVREAVDVSVLFASEHVGSPMIYDVSTSVVDFVNKKLVECSKAGKHGGASMNSNGASTRLVLDGKNAGYYFGTLPVLKRQCSDEVPHFSEKNFSAAGFVMYSKDVKEVEFNIWRREMPDIVVIHPIDRPTEPPLEIHADGVDAADLKEWMDLYLAQFSVVGISTEQSLLKSLVNWVASYRELDVADETLEGSDEVAQAGNVDDIAGMYMLDKLPSVAAMEQLIGRPIATGRGLTIITWGDKYESKESIGQLGATVHFNAKPLDGRGCGANLKVNATKDPQIVRNVVGSMMSGVGAMWLERAIATIEQENLHVVSTFCRQGRHRSVSSALILKHRYYPNAKIKHVKMK